MNAIKKSALALILGLSSVVSIGAVESNNPIHDPAVEMSETDLAMVDLQNKVDKDFLQAAEEDNLGKMQELLSGEVYPSKSSIAGLLLSYPKYISKKTLMSALNFKFTEEQKERYKYIIKLYGYGNLPNDYTTLTILNSLKNFGISKEEFHELKSSSRYKKSNEIKSAFEFAQFALYPESRPNDTVINFITRYARDNDADLGQNLMTGAFITACNTRQESADPLIIYILKKVINGDENAPPMELVGAMFDNLITNHANTYKESLLNKLPEYMRRFIISFGGDMNMQNFQDKSLEILNRVSEKDPETYNQFLRKMQEKGYLKSLHLVNIPNNNAVQNHGDPLENENNPEAVPHGTHAHALEENKEDHGA